MSETSTLLTGLDEDVANNNREDEDAEDDEDDTMEVGKENGDEEDHMDTSEKTSTNARNSNSTVSEQLKDQLQTISSTINQGWIH